MSRADHGAGVVPWSRRILQVPCSRGTVLRIDVRVLAVALVLTVVAVGVGMWTLTWGENSFSVSEVLSAIVGNGDPSVVRVVTEWRLPRVVVAVVAGAAFGASGAIFQSLTRNPLGSPDILGFSTGAYTGALVASLLLGLSHSGIAAGALIGGAGTGLLVYLLAWRAGPQSLKFIVIGIGLAATLSAINSYLLITVEVQQATSAAVWGAGSLADLTLQDARIVTVACLLLVPIAALLSVQSSLLELGDDHAASLGVRVRRARLSLTLAGLALISITTAVTGPIAFIALAAPPLARRLTRASGPNIIASAAMGAAVLTVCDALSRAFAPTVKVPVGLVTLGVGGVYLLWILLSRTGGRR